jgi:hypothetical protein
VGWFLRRVLLPSNPQQCFQPFLRVSCVLRQLAPERVIHAPVAGFHLPELSAFLRHQVFLRLLCWCCCLTILVAYFLLLLSSLLLIYVFWFFSVCCLLLCHPLVLLLSVAMVVLSWFSFADVVIGSSNSNIFHAAIKCLSSTATFGEGHAASQAVDVCSLIFQFLFAVLVLLLSVTLVALIWFFFAVVVISSSNSKIFHAAIKCLSSAAIFGEGHAASQAVLVCYFVFLFWSVNCLCSTLFCVHVVDGPLLWRHSEKHSQP